VRSFAYDAAGNLTQDSDAARVYGYTYNHAGRLASVTKDAQSWADYTYNGLGQLAVRSTAAPGGPSATMHPSAIRKVATGFRINCALP